MPHIHQEPSTPHIYHPRDSAWVHLQNDNTQEDLERGQTLTILSWNIDCMRPGVTPRSHAALRHLEERFSTNPALLVIMLQEVCNESFQVIQDDTWVRNNFVLSHITPPESIYVGGMKWQARPYYTLIMTPRGLAVSGFFRVPFPNNEMGRDGLFVDIPITSTSTSTRTRTSTSSGADASASTSETASNDILRLCTTHLESLSGRENRLNQLRLIAPLMKGGEESQNIIAGLVGGDMNSIYKGENRIHKARGVGLKDVWGDVPPPPAPVLKPGKKDLTYGLAKGNTFGYQSYNSKNRGRLDKFLYTGVLETDSTDKAQDTCRKLGRLGIGVTTPVGAWVHEEVKSWVSEGGNPRTKLVRRYLSEAAGFSGEGLVYKTEDAWFSDHFAITVCIRVKH